MPLVDFEHVILGNIKAPAHFLVVLTPSALERCDEPADWLRREIETALDIHAILCPSCWKASCISVVLPASAGPCIVATGDRDPRIS